MNKSIWRPLGILLAAAPVVLAIFCIGIGRYSLSASESARVLWNGLWYGREGVADPRSYSIIFNIRLPRIILALLSGMGLSVSGAAFQALFSNPLATADTLGVTAGASFGACLALLFHFNMIGVQLVALAFGLGAMLLISSLGRKKGKTTIVMMILAGIIMTSMFQAFLSLIKYFADPDNDLPSITYWLMGSLSSASYEGLLFGAPFIIAGVLALFLLRWKLNVLSLNEEEAQSMGINVQVMRMAVIFCATMIAASSVSMCGQVGWVGLLIPLIARMIYGSNNQRIIPACIGLGAAFMLIIDTIARAATGSEIPVSVLTATIGAPVFIFMLRKTGGVWL
ncbi:MAG: iron ABC transporter permease [Treponema sp.]|jgi:iron complex transport system permease protein|nr:iron ABC transporter permease [Treponema sp.]